MPNETKIETTVTEPPKKATPPPSKPEGEKERRLYQVTLKGKDKDGNTVVGGTQKKWLTKWEAKSEGFPWRE